MASGLWLAGRTPSSSLLPAAAIHAGPPLQKTSLVVLSACESALHPAEGRAVHEWRGLRIGVVPWSADANVVALHGFHVYDERVVTVSVLTGNATITDPLDVREYLTLFKRLEGLAVRGEELQALLKRIAEDHRRLG